MGRDDLARHTLTKLIEMLESDAWSKKDGELAEELRKMLDTFDYVASLEHDPDE